MFLSVPLPKQEFRILLPLSMTFVTELPLGKANRDPEKVRVVRIYIYICIYIYIYIYIYLYIYLYIYNLSKLT